MKAIFLDRDGILNVERGNYTYLLEDFKIMPDVIEVLQVLKNKNYKLIVITNQAGISLGLYSKEQMHECHRFFQRQSGNLIDYFYFAPTHPSISQSLSRKPDSLLFEKAINHFEIDTKKSWMVGDKERDLIPAKKLGIKTILLNTKETPRFADIQIHRVKEILNIIN